MKIIRRQVIIKNVPMDIPHFKSFRKIFSVLLMAGMLAFSPFATYAAEDGMATSTPGTLVEVIEPTDESVISPDVDPTLVVATTTDSVLTPPESEMPESINVDLEISTSTVEIIASSTITELVVEISPILEQPLSFVRTKIEPVQPPSRESFRNQPRLSVAPKPERVALLQPPPFVAPGEPLTSATTTTATSTDPLADVATTTDSVASTTDPVIQDPIVEPPVDEGTGTTTPDIIIPGDGEPIGTTTKEDLVPDEPSDEETDPGTDPSDSTEEQIEPSPDIFKPEESVEQITPEA